MAQSASDVVVLEYDELMNGKDYSAEIAKAYGPEGLGICVVRGVPGFAEARQALLPLANRLGKMPKDTLSKYELESASYCVGWSHGREYFKGVPDVAKGSFYANPVFDDPTNGDKDVTAKYPFIVPNVWPSEVPELEKAFKDMGRMLYETAKPLIKQCDKLVASKHPDYGTELYDATFTSSRLALGRLLHYFPGSAENWCGWHNDNSTITGLVPAMFLDGASDSETSVVSSEAGLYVQGREGAILKVAVPKDCMAFQIGEAAQIISGGVLRATPHYVKGHLSKEGEPQVSRESFALFMEPQWDKEIGPPKGAQRCDVLRGAEGELIPPLDRRWKPDEQGLVSFGKLLGDSFQEYYKHNNS
mmetsp:Transcript_20751/g.48185  ORF Transcript_20751/g.48185 Transcript_20751/m.48185 type:complete len:360 (-) Transcript_20751:68-1147(-)